MTRSRSPFQPESADLSSTLEDKSADHDVEVKTLADDTDTEPDPEPAPEPAGEPEAEVIDAVSVVMVHHHLHYVPGRTVVLDKPTADAWVSAHIARWPAQD